MGSGNQHGGRECDDLQNWLHMTSHENPKKFIFICDLQNDHRNIALIIKRPDSLF